MFNDLKKLVVLYKERTFCYQNDLWILSIMDGDAITEQLFFILSHSTFCLSSMIFSFLISYGKGT